MTPPSRKPDGTVAASPKVRPQGRKHDPNLTMSPGVRKSGVNLVVKRTFLEYVEAPGTPHTGPRVRAHTDVELSTIPESQGEEAPVCESTSVHETPGRRHFWPETPLVEVGCAPVGMMDPLMAMPPSMYSGVDDMDMAWLPPAVASQDQPCPMGYDPGFHQPPWMFMFGDYPPMEGKAWEETSTASGGAKSSHDCVAEGEQGEHLTGVPVPEWRTTIMLRNLPSTLQRDTLAQLLDNMGFYGQYDLVYIPVDFSTGSGLGYAFINAIAPCVIPNLWQALDGFSSWPIDGDSICSVSWSDPHQGLSAHLERYQNSPVMHPDVPDEWKPALFMHGVRVDFPPPTKKIKAPKVRSKKSKTEKEKAEKEAKEAAERQPEENNKKDQDQERKTKTQPAKAQ